MSRAIFKFGRVRPVAVRFDREGLTIRAYSIETGELVGKITFEEATSDVEDRFWRWANEMNVEARAEGKSGDWILEQAQKDLLELRT